MKRVEIIKNGTVTNSWTTNNLPEDYTEAGFGDPMDYERRITDLDNDPAYKLQVFNQTRQIEYQKEGANADAMIVALWERIVENRPQSCDDLQAKRAAVKQRVPKP